MQVLAKMRLAKRNFFSDVAPLTGITLTKLDGTAKGGVIFAIADQFGIPIRYIGVGEGIEDLRPLKLKSLSTLCLAVKSN